MAVNMFSVVDYYFTDVSRKYSCGYCKKRNSYKRHGMWAHSLTVQDYQTLIDRGWRRSGSYCYKPHNDETCCPMYTIKCEALNLIVSKSQKKIIKRVTKFLKDGKKDDDDDHYNKKRNKRTKIHHNKPNDVDVCSIMEPDYAEHAKSKFEILETEKMSVDMDCDNKRGTCCNNSHDDGDNVSNQQGNNEIDNTQMQPVTMVQDTNEYANNISQSSCSKIDKKITSESTSSHEDSGLPRKAKLIRIERARSRLLAKGKTLEEIEAYYKKKKDKNKPKTIDELLNYGTDGVNQLQVKLVRVSSEEFMETLDESVELFKKYQIAVHNDEPDECDKQSFLNFLGKTPLKHWKPESGPPLGYGSFHQQYWLNNNLMAVGVIDILPSCVSSVYFFYDPAYSFLSLGTYSSLMEVRLVRELNKTVPDLKYYYMGYYIHTIPKMRYKAKMRPSKLLCPETYKWFDIDKCIPKLNETKYSRLNDDLDALDEDGIINSEALMQVRVYYRGKMTYQNVRGIRRMFGDKKDDSNEVKEYAELVGKKCAHNMYLVRS
ncbi:arginyl-tRNA--protein transferase 1 [Microplitis mediator]|uniref:arginyl-tRNA--protein transferase 1 n=1 Tax=Microplitis mediator TaxID=375433 RepID=UPI002555C1F4|nr:arginyl-tRNA--protein transferase 1 [Microplitis mediator]